MRIHVDGGGWVDLPQDSFVAAGGEGTVHAVGDVAYKLFTTPVDEGRLRALIALSVRGAVLPRALIRDATGAVVGHTMDWVPRATPLSRALSRAWRDREGFGPDQALAAVQQLREIVREVHAAGALVVDLHEGNVLLDQRREPVLIDVSSWQLPGWPATAIQDAVRDRHATGFDRGTDWFAFAVTTLQLLLGVHPYRGTHPTVKGLDQRMVRRLSVLRPEVRLPPVAWPTDVVPPRWLEWYRAVLDGTERSAPPSGGSGGTGWTPSPVLLGRKLVLTPILTAPSTLRQVVEVGGTTAALVDGAIVTARGVFAGPWEAVLVSAEGAVVGAWREGRVLRLREVDGRNLPVTLHADAIAPLGSALIAVSGPRLVQLDLRAGLALPRVLATVLPHATQLFDGLAAQDLLGSMHLLLLSPGRCDVRRVAELDGWTILDARHAGGVAAVLARRDGRTDRFVFRFGPRGYELRRTEDVDGADLDLVVLPTGVAVLRIDGRLEIFRVRPGDDDLRLVEDAGLSGARVVSLGAQLGLVVGRDLARAALA
ncbi:MAG: hypothetical protein H6738_05490 [Alphaproteobacteria bacterium]|nr:hypothetical protein [Alphaproteobacteria bacterium]MCB9696221.1 hypothetical protein [Alphaproteobacteria bacterium]